MSDYSVPKVANNFSTINGAIAAVNETQDDFRFVPIIVIHTRSRPYW